MSDAGRDTPPLALRRGKRWQEAFYRCSIHCNVPVLGRPRERSVERNANRRVVRYARRIAERLTAVDAYLPAGSPRLTDAMGSMNFQRDRQSVEMTLTAAEEGTTRVQMLTNSTSSQELLAFAERAAKREKAREENAKQIAKEALKVAIPISDLPLPEAAFDVERSKFTKNIPCRYRGTVSESLKFFRETLSDWKEKPDDAMEQEEFGQVLAAEGKGVDPHPCHQGRRAGASTAFPLKARGFAGKESKWPPRRLRAPPYFLKSQDGEITRLRRCGSGGLERFRARESGRHTDARAGLLAGHIGRRVAVLGVGQSP